MSAAEIKISRILELLGKTDESTLDSILRMLSNSEEVEGAEWYESLSLKSKRLIAKGIEDANNGNFVDSDVVESKADELLGRK